MHISVAFTSITVAKVHLAEKRCFVACANSKVVRFCQDAVVIIMISL